jgi:hypothetical protein
VSYLPSDPEPVLEHRAYTTAEQAQADRAFEIWRERRIRLDGEPDYE